MPPELAEAFDPHRAPGTWRMMHVTNGDSAAGMLRRAEVPGHITVWADVLHDGPVPGGVSDEEFRETRAQFVASRGYATLDEARAITAEWDAHLEALSEYDEVVLWFEHDLFDQLILIRLLDWFSRRPLGSTRLSLICVSEFPGVEPFHGLGQLTHEQMASLVDTRLDITATQFDLGRAAWSAFTSTDPTTIERLLATDTSALPHLASAFWRLLEEYPSVENGLSRSQRQILETLEAGPASPVAVFLATQQLEERVFMGDATFWAIVGDLAHAPDPLMHLETTPVAKRSLPEGELSLTSAGRDVIARRADAVRLNGIDRWIGGVHLTKNNLWRWNGIELTPQF